MDYIFSGELNEIKTLYNVLKAVSFKEYATFSIMEEGIKITIDDLKHMQISAYVPRDVFQKYQLNISDDVMEKFKINIKLFAETLTVFGDDECHTLKMSYKKHGTPLCLLMAHDENIIIDCKISTLDCEDTSELSMPDENEVNNIILKAAPFMNMLSELNNNDILDIVTSPDPPYFQISYSGSWGEANINIPKHSEVIQSFNCPATLSAQYFCNSIKYLLKMANLTKRISISTSPDGLLGIQVIVNSENESKVYIEYIYQAVLE